MSKDIKNWIINITLIIVTIVLANYSAVYFGFLYHIFNPYVESGFFNWSLSKEVADYFIGIFLSYPFFTFLLFTLWGKMKKYIWALVLTILPFIKLLFPYLPGSYVYLIQIIILMSLGALIGWIVGISLRRLYFLIKIKNKNSG